MLSERHWPSLPLPMEPNKTVLLLCEGRWPELPFRTVELGISIFWWSMKIKFFSDMRLGMVF